MQLLSCRILKIVFGNEVPAFESLCKQNSAELMFLKQELKLDKDEFAFS